MDVPILANNDCQQWYKDEKKSIIIVDKALCAGLENGGKDSCQVKSFNYRMRWILLHPNNVYCVCVLFIYRVIAADLWWSKKMAIIYSWELSALESVAQDLDYPDYTRALIIT